MASDPNALEAWLQMQEDPILMNELAKSFGLTTDDLRCIPVEHKRKAQARTKQLFEKNGKDRHATSDEPQNTAASLPKPVDLDALDLDDENGDWCKCSSPGCIELEDIVSFVCGKCMKVNRVYARKALAANRRWKSEGKECSWIGPNAEEKARKASGK